MTEYEQWLAGFERSINETMHSNTETSYAFQNIDTNSIQARLDEDKADSLHLNAERCEELTAKARRLNDMVRELRQAVDEMADEIKTVVE